MTTHEMNLLTAALSGHCKIQETLHLKDKSTINDVISGVEDHVIRLQNLWMKCVGDPSADPEERTPDDLLTALEYIFTQQQKKIKELQRELDKQPMLKRV